VGELAAQGKGSQGFRRGVGARRDGFAEVPRRCKGTVVSRDGVTGATGGAREQGGATGASV